MQTLIQAMDRPNRAEKESLMNMQREHSVGLKVILC